MAHRGFFCELTTPDVEPELSDDASLTIYRIVQECLTNVARHSKADRVEIAVGLRPGKPHHSNSQTMAWVCQRIFGSASAFSG